MVVPASTLACQTLKDVTLWPMVPGSIHANLGYVLAPQFGSPFGHYRFRKERTINTASYRPAPLDAAGREVPGTSLYGGVIFSQFGHFIAESLHRLWAIGSEPGLADAPIAFHTAGRKMVREGDYPGWMREIFALLGIDTGRIVLIDQATRFERLVIPSQGSILGWGPVTPDYKALFPPKVRGGSPPEEGTGSPRLYVSRSRFLHGGSYLGEALIEDMLARDAGFEILHPQEHSIAAVVRKFEGTETAVFSEGSALHLLELCRRTPRNIFVICRRKYNAFHNYFENMLIKASERMEFFPVVEVLVPLDWSSRRNEPGWQNASALVDLAALTAALAGFCGIALELPAEADIRRAQALSLLQAVIDPRTTGGQTTPEDLGRLLVALRDQVNRLDVLPWPASNAAAANNFAEDDGDDESPRREPPARPARKRRSPAA